jgi:hypothetical protein
MVIQDGTEGRSRAQAIVGKMVLVWWHDDHPDFRGL